MHLPHFVSSVETGNDKLLDVLSRAMGRYYRETPYHDEWIKGRNADWVEGGHDAQIAMCGQIPAGAIVLEAGCGDGAGSQEIHDRCPTMRYYGFDLRPAMRKTGGFVAGRADAIPFASSSCDVVVSMFVIEHLARPHRFLDEAWRVLKPSGIFLLVAPDFLGFSMASEILSRSYSSGRELLCQGRLWDAFLTGLSTRVLFPLRRRRRRRSLRSGKFAFPVLLNPRCLTLPGFVPDCDAVYPACPEEIANYLKTKPGCDSVSIFARTASSFGLNARKVGAA
jgi:SAM-dependent methyltransferase